MPFTSTSVRNAMLNAVRTEANAASAPRLEVYAGSNPGNATGTAGTLLVAIPLTAGNVFSTSTANSLALAGTPTANATAAGTPTHARLLASSGGAVIIHFSASLTGGGGEITADVAPQVNSPVTVTGLTLTMTT